MMSSHDNLNFFALPYATATRVYDSLKSLFSRFGILYLIRFHEGPTIVKSQFKRCFSNQAAQIKYSTFYCPRAKAVVKKFYQTFPNLV